jgi:hypothetical protein
VIPAPEYTKTVPQPNQALVHATVSVKNFASAGSAPVPQSRQNPISAPPFSAQAKPTSAAASSLADQFSKPNLQDREQAEAAVFLRLRKQKNDRLLMWFEEKEDRRHLNLRRIELGHGSEELLLKESWVGGWGVQG